MGIILEHLILASWNFLFAYIVKRIQHFLYRW